MSRRSRSAGRSFAAALAWLFVVDALSAQQGETEPRAKTTVGMRVELLEVVIPGPELEPVPVEDAQVVDAVVRVLHLYQHGPGAWRYDFEVMPLVPGRIDLRDHLQRVDGGELRADLPPLVIEAESLLPPERLEPTDVPSRPMAGVGGYGTLWTLAAVLWIVGLLAILLVGRGRRRGAVVDAAAKPRTLADRLLPLVERARDGSLEEAGRAELERLLLAHWRRRRSLGDVPVGRAVQMLRADPEAGPLLLKIEEWLHRPAGAAETVDVAELLAPYREIVLQEDRAPGGTAS